MGTTFELYELSGGDRGMEVLHSSGHASVEAAVTRAEEDAIPFFVIYREGAGSYIYCSW